MLEPITQIPSNEMLAIVAAQIEDRPGTELIAQATGLAGALGNLRRLNGEPPTQADVPNGVERTIIITGASRGIGPVATMPLLGSGGLGELL